MKKEATLENLKAVKCRSAWSKGVKEYAYMLLDNIFNDSDYESIINFKSLHKALLNGAPNWKRFSYGCCALVTNEDIAKTLCNPSELKNVKTVCSVLIKRKHGQMYKQEHCFRRKDLSRNALNFNKKEGF